MDEDDLIAEFERDADDPNAWVEDPAPPGPQRRLGAQITIRLEPDVADLLRAYAAHRQVNYTAIAREFIVEGLQRRRRRSPRPRRSAPDEIDLPDAEIIRMWGEGWPVELGLAAETRQFACPCGRGSASGTGLRSVTCWSCRAPMLRVRSG